jgi:hypothetical protein
MLCSSGKSFSRAMKRRWDEDTYYFGLALVFRMAFCCSRAAGKRCMRVVMEERPN